MSIIKRVTPLLGKESLMSFKKCISTYNMERARVIIDMAKDNYEIDSREYITLDGVENDIINEIESMYDNAESLVSTIY